MTAEPPQLTVLIPFYNEAPNVAPLLEELRTVLTTAPFCPPAGPALAVEVLLVDDGSSDGTAVELDAAAARWSAIRVEHFPVNRGQAAALWWGFRHARGAWIATLDGDGQNPPAELARLWTRRAEADLICGIRAQRRDSRLRRVMSRIANATRRALLRDGVRDTGCSLKLFRREVAESFLPIRTLYSFLPAFAVAGGWKVIETPVDHRPRRAGESKYGLRVMALHPLMDLLALAWVLRRSLRRR
ncbi:MAG: glycosyltransferase family 2 protein [Verrucomicrobia bacterium]|nr:glycosyltransferase family 2 protein [Verrucomicrobiota bacterium]